MQDDAPIAPTETAHQRGIRLFQEARFEEAAHELAESLQENQNSETWNDWAVAELNAGHSKAETGFRSALALDAENYEAAANLGALLANSGRHAEAILYLEKALGHADQQPVVLKQLLDSCSRKAFSENMLRESGETARKFAASVQEYPAPATSQVEPRPAFDGSPSAIATLKQEISRIDWYHQIGLGQGIVTPGCHDSNRELRTLQLPERLDGLKVLDIGAWDGFFSLRPSDAAPPACWQPMVLFGVAGALALPKEASTWPDGRSAPTSNRKSSISRKSRLAKRDHSTWFFSMASTIYGGHWQPSIGLSVSPLDS